MLSSVASGLSRLFCEPSAQKKHLLLTPDALNPNWQTTRRK